MENPLAQYAKPQVINPVKKEDFEYYFDEDLYSDVYIDPNVTLGQDDTSLPDEDFFYRCCHLGRDFLKGDYFCFEQQNEIINEDNEHEIIEEYYPRYNKQVYDERCISGLVDRKIAINSGNAFSTCLIAGGDLNYQITYEDRIYKLIRMKDNLDVINFAGFTETDEYKIASNLWFICVGKEDLTQSNQILKRLYYTNQYDFILNRVILKWYFQDVPVYGEPNTYTEIDIFYIGLDDLSTVDLDEKIYVNGFTFSFGVNNFRIPKVSYDYVLQYYNNASLHRNVIPFVQRYNISYDYHQEWIYSLYHPGTYNGNTRDQIDAGKLIVAGGLLAGTYDDFNWLHGTKTFSLSPWRYIAASYNNIENSNLATQGDLAYSLFYQSDDLSSTIYATYSKKRNFWQNATAVDGVFTVEETFTLDADGHGFTGDYTLADIPTSLTVIYGGWTPLPDTDPLVTSIFKAKTVTTDDLLPLGYDKRVKSMTPYICYAFPRILYIEINQSNQNYTFDSDTATINVEASFAKQRTGSEEWVLDFGRSTLTNNVIEQDYDDWNYYKKTKVNILKLTLYIYYQSWTGKYNFQITDSLGNIYFNKLSAEVTNITSTQSVSDDKLEILFKSTPF